MIDEIGSEFWNVPITNRCTSIWPEHIQWYLSGRSALQAIIDDIKNIQSIAMPSWCCHTMLKPFVDRKIKVCFYPVYYEDGRLIQEPIHSCDALFLLDYFGYTADAPDLSHYKGITIRDITHSVFSVSYSDADYYFGSLRKWCGVRTGGYAWTGDGHLLPEGDSDDGGYALLREKAMQMKDFYINRYVNHNGEQAAGKKYLEIFEEAENLLDHCGITSAERRDIELAERLDLDFIRSQRRINARILMDAFPEMLIFKELREKDCPLFVPILVPGGRRDEIRRYLTGKDIYCPAHWPLSENHRLDCREKKLYEQELSLVCDQRYTEKNMQRMIEAIKEFWRENR